MDDATGAEQGSDRGPELAEGIDHLQRAARELVAAARSFLDVVEQVVEDDERLSGAATAIADMVSRGVGAAGGRDLADGLLGGLTGREPSWLRNDPDHPDAPDDDPFFGDAPTDPPSAETEPVEPEAPKRAPAKKAPAERASAKSAPAKKAPAKKAPAQKAPAQKAPEDEPAAQKAAQKAAATPRTRRVTRISVD